MSQPEATTRTQPVDDVDAYEAALKLLVPSRALTPLGHEWRQRAAQHLTERLDASFRDGTPRLSTEAAALSFLKSAARDLRAASAALMSAADRLRNEGDAWGANQAHSAARGASRAADHLDPNE